MYSEGASTGNAKTCLNNTAGYRLGVISLENIPGGSDVYKFVKIDGVSPNYTPGGTADPKQRQALASGAYTYAFEMYSMIQPGSPANVVAFANTLNAKLGDSTKSDLVGIAYFDLPGTWVSNSLTNQQTRVTRNSNNCGNAMF